MEDNTISEEPAKNDNTESKGLQIWEQKEIEFVQTKTIRRITFANFWAEVGDALNLDRGFLHTMKGLTIAPAKTIIGYLDTRRFTITNPFKYFLLIVGITVFIANLNGYFNSQVDAIEYGYKMGQGDTSNISPEKLEKSEQFLKEFGELFKEYFIKYQNIWSALSIFFTSIFSFLFFRKTKFNFLENMTMNTYIYSHTYLFFLIMVIFSLKGMFWSNIYLLLHLVYTIVVFKGVFQGKWTTTIVKGLLITVLNMIFFISSIVIVLLGYYIAFIK